MTAIDLPRDCSHLTLFDVLGEARIFVDPWEKLVLRIPPKCFVSSAAIAFLSSWGQSARAEGRVIEFMGDPDAMRYLSRMDLFESVGFEYRETFQRHNAAGRFIPLKRIEDDDSVLAASNEICDLVLRNFENGREFVPAIEWAIYELVDNIHLHSETPVPGTVCAQFYPAWQRVNIGICDVGRGIRASLKPKLESWDGHGAAIAKAVERGVTRDSSVGQGNGLAGSKDICLLNGGEFMLWSGNANYIVDKGQDKGYKAIPLVPGTGIFLSLDTNRPVRLSETFIGDSGWSYVNYLGEQLAEAGGIKVREHCVHAGSRQSAQQLRRMAEAILPDLDGQLVLDFEGVENASSSFLDELLGRLIAGMGQQAFSQKIRLVNMPESMVDMANVVIHQRVAA